MGKEITLMQMDLTILGSGSTIKSMVRELSILKKIKSSTKDNGRMIRNEIKDY